MTDPSRRLLFRLGAAVAISQYFPLGESTMTCSAFTDGQHRYAFSRQTPHGNDVFECACGQPTIDANERDLLTVDENTDFAALPFRTGYNVEDYSLAIQKAAYIAAKDGDDHSMASAAEMGVIA